MSNGLTNAGFIDGTTGWASASGLALMVDETQRGAPGRAALVASGSVAGGGTARLSTSTPGRAPVSAFDPVDAFVAVSVRVAGVPITPMPTLTFWDAGGAGIGASLPLAVNKPLLDRHGQAVMGVATTFHHCRLRTVAPAGAARASLEIAVTVANPGTVEIAFLKPFAGRALGSKFEVSRWDPGLHVSEELQLDVWPTILRPFDVGQGSEPKPWAVEFDAGSAAPTQRRVVSDPARKFTGRVRCDDVQRAALEEFARSATRFWFVEPDSDRLCVARFAGDGAPRLSETRAAIHVMEVGLWLETA